MGRCNGCGGVIGVDCFNPQECQQIAQAMLANSARVPSCENCDDMYAEFKKLQEKCEQAERERDECRAALKRMVDHHVYFFRTDSDEVFTEEDKLAAVVFVAGHTVESYRRLIGKGE